MLMETIKLSARGTIIEVPKDVIKKSPVITAFLDGNWSDSSSAYYLNYSAETVHLIIDFLSDNYNYFGEIDFDKIKKISDELIIENKISKIHIANSIALNKQEYNKIHIENKLDRYCYADQVNNLSKALTFISYKHGHHIMSNNSFDIGNSIDDFDSQKDLLNMFYDESKDCYGYRIYNESISNFSAINDPNIWYFYSTILNHECEFDKIIQLKIKFYETKKDHQIHSEYNFNLYAVKFNK